MSLVINAKIGNSNEIFYLEVPLPDGWRTAVLAKDTGWERIIDNLNKIDPDNLINARLLKISRECYFWNDLLKTVGEGNVKITLEKI